MSLQEELVRIREYLTNGSTHPSNEANTCSWVIRPLLHQSGYNYHEIDEQAHNGAGNIPDFALLPNTPYTWFLEAKAWHVALTDLHINQATGYAHTTGQRWVVVSNGREWRLYDNYNVQVPPPERLVTCARLECGTELEELLAALSKASVQSGKIDHYAQQTRLSTLMKQQLQTSSSEVIKSVTNVLKTKFGFSTITPTDVLAFFQGIAASPSPSSPPDTMSGADPVPIVPPSTNGTFPLPELLAMGLTVQGSKPATLTFPDGTAKPVSSWRDVVMGVVERILLKGKMPTFPFRGRKSGKLCFINTQPFHPGGAKMTYRPLVLNGQTLYVHVNRSAPDFLGCLQALCTEVGESPEGFKVTLR